MNSNSLNYTWHAICRCNGHRANFEVYAMECAPTSRYPRATYTERDLLRIELSTITTGSLGSRCALTSSRALLDILDLVFAEGLADCQWHLRRELILPLHAFQLLEDLGEVV